MLPSMLSKSIAFFSPARLHHLHLCPLFHGRRSPARGHRRLFPAPSPDSRPTTAVTAGQSIVKADPFAWVCARGLRTRPPGTSTQPSPSLHPSWAAAAASDRASPGLRGDGVSEMETMRSASAGAQESRHFGGGEGDGKNGGSVRQKEEASSLPGLITLPTVLTLARVAAVPLLISMYYMNGRFATTATTTIFVAAAITDWLDGYIARKMRLRTTFGAFLDPVADKLMVAATLVLLCTRPLEVALFVEFPWLLTVPAIAIIAREITMSAVREWAASQDGKVLEAVAVNNLGKWKTATQMAALTILLASRDPSLSGFGVLTASGVVLLYISSGLAVWSLAVYMKNISRVLRK